MLIRIINSQVMGTWLVISASEGYHSQCEDVVGTRECGDSIVVAVADGAGGQTGGLQAAQLAIHKMLERADGQATRDWRVVLEELDRFIERDPDAGETTGVIAMASPDGIRGASVGDSGAWLVDDLGYKDLTVRQQRKPLLGSGSAFATPFEYFGDLGTLVVATDGLFKYTSPERICNAVREQDLAQAERACIDLVRLRSGALQDDVGIALCRRVL